MADGPRFATGCKKDPYDPQDFQMRHLLAAAPRLDRVDHRAEMPAIFDGGKVGTCVACAVGYYDKTFQEQRENHWGMNTDDHRFSPLFIYSQRTDAGTDGGMTTARAMNDRQPGGRLQPQGHALPRGWHRPGTDERAAPGGAPLSLAQLRSHRQPGRGRALPPQQLLRRRPDGPRELHGGHARPHPDAHGRRPLRGRPRALHRWLRTPQAAADLRQLLGPRVGRLGLRLHQLRRFSGTSDGYLGDGRRARFATGRKGLNRPGNTLSTGSPQATVEKPGTAVQSQMFRIDELK